MEKHVTLVGILNIVYRSLVLLGAGLLFAISVGFGYLFHFLVQSGYIEPHEIPIEILNIIPLVLLFIATLMALVSLAGIIGAIWVLRRKEWARVVLLVVSFFNLLRIPLGTILGVYSIWVLMSDETVRLFSPTH